MVRYSLPPLEADAFRAQAAAFRRLAQGMLDGDFRSRLLSLAADYERQASDETEHLARHLEERGFVVARKGSAAGIDPFSQGDPA
jgi:hypothetical protein